MHVRWMVIMRDKYMSELWIGTMIISDQGKSVSCLNGAIRNKVKIK